MPADRISVSGERECASQKRQPKPLTAEWPGGKPSANAVPWSDAFERCSRSSKTPIFQEPANPIKQWLCQTTQGSGVTDAANAVSTAGTAADASSPLVALGATAAGGSRALATPQAVFALGGIISEGLSALGPVGTLAAGVGIAFDAISGHFQSALYDTMDAVTYGGLSLVGAAGAVFLHHVKRLWLRTLRRRSQRHRMTWVRFSRIAADFLPSPRILYPWPETRFCVTHPRWKPSA